MRHHVSGRKLNRSRNHRQSLFKNLIVSVITHHQVTTTEAKAKAVQSMTDKLITQAKQGSVHARRLLNSFLRDKDAVNTLVDQIVPQIKTRTSGYTRITRLGERRGDNSMMVKLKLVDAPQAAPVKLKTARKKSPAKKAKTILAKGAPKTVQTVKAPVATKVSSQAHRTQSKG